MSGFRSPGASWGHGPHCYSKASQSLLGENKAGRGMQGGLRSSWGRRLGGPVVRHQYRQQDGAGQLVPSQSTQGLHSCPQSPGEDLGEDEGERPVKEDQRGL